MIREAFNKDKSLSLSIMCRLAGVSRSGYYGFLKCNNLKKNRDLEALKIINHHFEISNKKAGIIMLDMILRRNGHIINHKKIARIKREYGLYTKIRRRNPYKGIILNAKTHKLIPNVLNRNFIQPLADKAYSTDMTYLYYGKCEKAYLSATKDLGTNEIVSYNLMRTPAVSQFVDEFKRLLSKLPKDKRSNLLIHSDQGFQYTHPYFIELLKNLGVTQSMSRRGNCLDNAPIENFFGTFKDLAELKECKTYEEVCIEVTKTINYYNNERPQKSLNKKPPAECRGLLNCFF